MNRGAVPVVNAARMMQAAPASVHVGPTWESDPCCMYSGACW